MACGILMHEGPFRLLALKPEEAEPVIANALGHARFTGCTLGQLGLRRAKGTHQSVPLAEFLVEIRGKGNRRIVRHRELMADGCFCGFGLCQVARQGKCLSRCAVACIHEDQLNAAPS
jgi:hypothetical protein